MATIEERLDKVRELLQDKDFLEGKGLSNEVNIRLFCYEPEEEMAVRRFLSQLTADSSLPCRLLERNLYEIFLSACEEMDILDSIDEIEEADGSAFLLEQLQAAVGEGEFVERIHAEPPMPGDVLLLTGVGEVYPFMRLHKLLEALQPHYANTPILVMYPGEFDGRHLKLFNHLRPNDYYRAFSVI